MMDSPRVLPKPKKILSGRGAFALPGGAIPCWVPEGAGLSAFFAENGRRFRRVSDPERAAVVARIDPRALAGRAPDPTLLEEGYELEVSTRGVALSARTDRGLYYGLQTLRQLTQAAPRLAAIRIEDWPDMKFRGLHLMLGCLMPTFERMKRIVEILARHKINAFVVEYDHCFKWEKYPFIPHPNAYTRSQTRELEAFAADRFVEIIPCLDSLGHLEPYLGHKELAHLREAPDSPGSLCPSNPKAVEFMKDLWREVLDAHPRSRRAGITGDEVFGGSGENIACPACRAKVRKDGVGALIVDYYTQLSRWILAQGRVPVMWDDMLAKQAEATPRLPNDIILCDWMYDNLDAEAWTAEDLYWHRTVGRLPHVWERLFARYWTPNSRGEIRPFPYLRYFRDKGNPVLGCPAGSGGGALPHPSTSHRHANIMRFAQAIKDAGTMGMLNTFWPMPTPLESAWNSVLMGADYAWHARVEPPAAFADRFGCAFLGMKRGGAELLQELDQTLTPETTPGRTALLAKAWPEKSRAPLTRVSRALTRTVRDADRAPFVRIMDWCARFAEVTARLGAEFNRIDAVRLGRGRDEPVDLTRHLTHGFLDATVPGAFAVPFVPGTRRLGGVEFAVADPARHKGRAVITLRGRRMRNAPLSVGPIELNRRADRLFILCSGYDTYSKVTIADVMIRMENGAEHRFPIVGGRNILDWSGGGYQAMPEGLYVTERRYRKGCVCWWDNPTPKQRIASLRFVSSGVKGSLTVAGVTTRVFGGKPPALDAARALRTIEAARHDIRGLIRELTGTIYPAIMPRRDVAAFTGSLEGLWRNWMTIYRRLLRKIETRRKIGSR
jgi:hypothetical protein